MIPSYSVAEDRLGNNAEESAAADVMLDSADPEVAVDFAVVFEGASVVLEAAALSVAVDNLGRSCVAVDRLGRSCAAMSDVWKR